ncbi:hypothetical protein ACOSQ2_021722 [Xanthoceras sorbifolium]
MANRKHLNLLLSFFSEKTECRSSLPKEGGLAARVFGFASLADRLLLISRWGAIVPARGYCFECCFSRLRSTGSCVLSCWCFVFVFVLVDAGKLGNPSPGCCVFVLVDAGSHRGSVAAGLMRFGAGGF